MKKILYYSIISKYVEFDSTCKTRIVQLSKDGIKLDKIVGYYWPDSLIHLYKQFPAGNRFLEACLDSSLKINPNASKKDREEFIQLKYKKCVFVAQRGQHDEKVDIYNSIRKRELLSVYKDMCTMKYLQVNNELLYQTLIEKSGYKNYTPLHLAASIGDPLICHLIALNMEDPSVLDDGGWSALSYAAYYGRSEAAEVLLKDGVDPKKTVENHPYYIARSKNRIDMATMFLPYWEDDEKVAPKRFLPPVTISESEESENANSRYASLEALGKMNMNLI